MFIQIFAVAYTLFTSKKKSDRFRSISYQFKAYLGSQKVFMTTYIERRTSSTVKGQIMLKIIYDYKDYRTMKQTKCPASVCLQC